MLSLVYLSQTLTLNLTLTLISLPISPLSLTFITPRPSFPPKQPLLQHHSLPTPVAPASYCNSATFPPSAFSSPLNLCPVSHLLYLTVLSFPSVVPPTSPASLPFPTKSLLSPATSSPTRLYLTHLSASLLFSDLTATPSSTLPLSFCSTPPLLPFLSSPERNTSLPTYGFSPFPHPLYPPPSPTLPCSLSSPFPSLVLSPTCIAALALRLSPLFSAPSPVDISTGFPYSPPNLFASFPPYP